VQHIEERFAGVAGVEIYWQAWQPEPGDDTKAVLVISHGFGEHSGRYGHVADALVEAGYAVYALDHRGHGRSQGTRARIDRWSNALADLGTLLGRARDNHPGLPVFLLGHSMGGALALSYAAGHQAELAGLALSGPVATLDAAPPVVRLAAQVLSRIAPGLGVYQVDPSNISRDAEVVRAYEQDPLVHHGKLPARTGAEMTGAVMRFPDETAGLKLPLLLMHGTDDRLAPVAGTKMVAERAASTDKTVHLYEGLYHEILNEPERDRVIGDLRSWLDGQLAS
jgi:alpha-beta hydrolase superfamily lysophospholipase